MPTCNHCDATPAPEDLIRHEEGALLLVHCPECHGLLGTYQEPGRQ